jgi:hypothetical protein
LLVSFTVLHNLWNLGVAMDILMISPLFLLYYWLLLQWPFWAIGFLWWWHWSVSASIRILTLILTSGPLIVFSLS